MTLVFMLALSSALVRWLRLFRVCALKRRLNYFNNLTFLHELHDINPFRYDPASPTSSELVGRVGANDFIDYESLANRCRYFNGQRTRQKPLLVIHAPEYASARARRQAPTVLELREKRQTLKLEFA